ncbi:MAG: Calx-beta domain-containing protein [Lewinella sp.]|uniref:Calx-beta domain-containing protein n=1 Tax=Lewinella sp. TaxID=2004506 RepID=UPI003D6BBDF0
MKIFTKLSFLIVALCCWGIVGYGQGSETFTNSNATGSYNDGSYTGDNGVTWTYVESRDDAGYQITGTGLLLRQLSDNSKVTSSSVSGGIGNFTCKLKKGFTGAGNRQVELFVNGTSQGTSIAWDNTTVQTFTVNNINVSGNIIIEVRNITNKQVVIDDISWTSFPVASTTSIQFANTTYSLAEDGLFVEVCAAITNPDATNATMVEVDLNTGSSTAINGTDYDDGASMAIPFPITLTFPANSSTDQCFDIFISNDDTDVEGNETIELELQNASGGNSAAIGGISTSTVTIIDNDFAPITCPSGTEEQSQGFEGGGSWAYSVSGNSQSIPCNSSPDYIGEAASIGTGGNTISASGGNQFFAVRDIQGDCAGSNGVDLVFNTFSVTSATEGNYAISFDYNAYEWDSGDDISYEISVNSSIVSSGNVVSGFSNFSTGGWQTETINISLMDGDDLDLIINLDQNGDGDWGGVDNVVLCFVSILPVKLTTFEAIIKNKTSVTSWQTATEENNSHFLIQRSTDEGKTFETIGQVDGKGDSNSAVDYQFVDTKPAAGMNYYRLQQFDFDGTNEFFGPVAVRFGGEVADAPVIWPVPARDRLQVQLPASDSDWQLEVYDLNGRRLLQKTTEEKGINTFFDLNTLPAGSYFLRWSNGSQSGQERFLKV